MTNEEIIIELGYFIQEVLRETRVNFGHNIANENFEFRVKIGKRYKRAWGGRTKHNIYFITIPLDKFHLQYHEYASFKFPIAGFKTTNRITTLKAVICHELSHCITVSLFNTCLHNEQFKQIYGYLRQKYINHEI